MMKIPSSEITPEQIYRSRRQFMTGIGALVLGSAALGACGREQTAPSASVAGAPTTASGKATDERGDPVNTFEQITNYNNYYEFTTDKERVASMAKDFKTSPWTLTVGG